MLKVNQAQLMLSTVASIKLGFAKADDRLLVTIIDGTGWGDGSEDRCEHELWPAFLDALTEDQLGVLDDLQRMKVAEWFEAFVAAARKKPTLADRTAAQHPMSVH